MRRGLIICIIVLGAVAALCSWYFISEYLTAQDELQEYTKMQDKYTSLVESTDLVESTESAETGQAEKLKQSETAGLPYVLVDFESLMEMNEETIGWVAIPETLINYPVMHTDSNKKYLQRSSSGEKSSAGAVFMDKNNSTAPLDTNTILYGHNMGDGRTDMFGTLIDYSDKGYYDTHKYIQFDTVQKQYGWWKIFAVINLDIKSGEFDYLKLSFKDNAEFNAWIKAAKKLSLYDTGVAVKPNSKVLTLSTCDRSNYGKSGRQLVLAVLQDN